MEITRRYKPVPPHDTPESPLLSIYQQASCEGLGKLLVGMMKSVSL